MSTPFVDLASDPPIRGFLHEPSQPRGRTLVLTHGAGANCQSKLLVEMSDAFAAPDFTVLRFDFPSRSERPYRPPSPGSALRHHHRSRRLVLKKALGEFPARVVSECQIFVKKSAK